MSIRHEERDLRVRILTFAAKLGHGEAGLWSHYYDEFIRLSEHVRKLIIVTERRSQFTLPSTRVQIHRAPIPSFRGVRGLLWPLLYTGIILRYWKIYDTVYTRTYMPAELMASLVAASLGKPVVFLLQATSVFAGRGLKTAVWTRVLGRLLSESRLIVIYSENMIPSLLRMAPEIDRRKVRVVPNAVDPDRFKPNVEPSTVIQPSSISPTLLFVGRIIRSKGVEDIVKAASIIVRKVPSVRVLIVGDDPHSQYGAYLRRLAEDLKVADAVNFTGGVPNQNIPGLIREATASVYMSRGIEGQTRFLLESMACGVPIVATPVAGNKDLIIEGVTGFAVQPKDWKSLAEKALFLIENPETAKAMGRHGMKLVKDKHCWSKTMPQLINVFREAVR